MRNKYKRAGRSPLSKGASTDWAVVDGADYLSSEVFEPEETHVSTGLLDADGVPIVRDIRMAPIGFVRFKE